MLWWLLSIGFMAPPPATAFGAVQAYERGHISQAYTLSKSVLLDPNANTDDQETALLVEAFALLRMGRLNDSQASLEAIKTSNLDLGPYLDLLRIQAATGSGRCAEALAMGREVPNDSVFATKAWSQVVECALRARDKELCAQSLEAMTPAAQDDNEQAALALMKARYAELQGDKLQARDRLRDLIINFPFSTAARLARNYLNTLARHGVTVTPLNPEELLPRAEGERVAAHNDTARLTYRNVLRQSARHHGDNEVQNLAQLGLVQLDISEQHYSRARSRLGPILSRTNDAEIKAQAMFLDGDLLARRGRVTDAIGVWEACVNEHGDQPFARVAAINAAQRAYDTQDVVGARKYAQWLLAQPPKELGIVFARDDGAVDDTHSDANLRDQALWLLAWIGHRTGESVPTVDSYLAQIDQRGPLAEASLYWRARISLDGNDIEAATVFTRTLVHESPTSLYALMAFDVLSRANPACGVQLGITASNFQDTDSGPEPTSEPVDLKAAVTLFKHGMRTEARHFLRLLPVLSLSEADRGIAAYVYRRCGDVRRAAMLSRKTVERRRDDPDLALIPLAYPRPYDKFVNKTARDFGVPSELIYAIMREESAFNPQVVSSRQAWGLMQIIYPTAKRLAQAASVHHLTTSRLLDPATAIRLGGYYLKTLMKRWDGDLAATVAAYQAGERNVDRWRANRGNLRPDEFIEEIPYSSTRSYVRNVLAAYTIYRVLGGTPVEEAVHLFQAPQTPEP